jgi:hypothetical protein
MKLSFEKRLKNDQQLFLVFQLNSFQVIILSYATGSSLLSSRLHNLKIVLFSPRSVLQLVDLLRARVS